MDVSSSCTGFGCSCYTDTADADLDTLALVKKYAKRRETAHLFNYASMAHNNHFFFHRLVSSFFPFLSRPIANNLSG